MSSELIDTLVAAGVLGSNVEANEVRRVVVDINAGRFVTIHVERYGDDRLAVLGPSLDGVHISRGEPAETVQVRDLGHEKPRHYPVRNVDDQAVDDGR